MTADPKVSPRPWTHGIGGRNLLSYGQAFGIVSIADPSRAVLVAGVFADAPGGYETCEANAAHIVRCVNAHDGLVEALEATEAMLTIVVNFILKLAPGWTNLESADVHPTIQKARAALAAAKEGV